MTDKTHTCEMCGDEYEEYAVFITDDFNSIVTWRERKREYEHLCPDCNEKWHDENGLREMQ